ncbi:phage portal protein [Clostridium scatologenes]|uniref:Phage portal protein, SPP1 family n=1 Tax=Clostridium scatologenes TaxID=1548 RepID=A0A0E3K3W0_CLOSL|nr:phage portal protein [Clostridium scatologenes]AKA71964.1 phage portal protein, SPP1 family [Clostridium scatologenes]
MADNIQETNNIPIIDTLDINLRKIVIDCTSRYDSEHLLNESKYNYYHDHHDILDNYKTNDRRSNQICQCNFIGRFIDEEISYICGKPVSFVPKNGDSSVIMDIDYYMSHWSKKHNQTVCRDLSIFGKVYELYYISADLDFCSKVLNPLNSFGYIDENNNVVLFLYFYRKAFDSHIYVDIYTDKEIITVYKGTLQVVSRRINIFNRVPVSFATIDRTVFDMIKTLNDSYNITLSNAVNENSDFRSAYLKITGASIKEEDIQFFDKKGIINVPKDCDIDFLIKQLNDNYLRTTLKETKDNIYECTGHIDTSEKLSSNTSSLALRGRLLTLEQRCQLIADSMTDVVKLRLKFLFLYLKNYLSEYKNKDSKTYNWKNIDVNFTPNIPTDLSMLADVISKLGGVELSQETKLSLLPFIENPKLELKKIKNEQDNNMLDLDEYNPYDTEETDESKVNIPDNGSPANVPNPMNTIGV